jgi:serine/threonine-protein kinase
MVFGKLWGRGSGKGMVESSSVELLPGALLAGKYRIERLLGRGGMGAVYAAQHELLCRRVAVKLLLTDTNQNPDGLQRFLNEARAAARLDSEHVARVMEFGTLDDGVPFMVLEYLEGQDLAELLVARGPLPVSEAVDYILEACEGLAEAHANGIVHRDLKPSNLYLARGRDGTSRIKVLDFGISKVSDDSLTPKALTSTRGMLGTPLYMSPEQFSRPKEIDARSDIWQLGVNLYELLAGSPPFVRETLGEQISAIMHDPVPPLAERRPEVPAELEQAIRRCLERDVSLRFASVAEVAESIAPFGRRGPMALGVRTLDTMTLGRPPSVGGGKLASSDPWFRRPTTGRGSVGRPTPQPGETKRRSRLVAALALGSVLAIAAVAAGVMLAIRDHSDPVVAASPSTGTAVPVPAAPPEPSTPKSVAPDAAFAAPGPSPPEALPIPAPPPPVIAIPVPAVASPAGARAVRPPPVQNHALAPPTDASRAKAGGAERGGGPAVPPPPPVRPVDQFPDNSRQ